VARLVARERDAATQRLWDSLYAALTAGQRATLDALLEVPPGARCRSWSGGGPGTTVYAASKTPARSFARTWTAELKDRNIRVNVLSPGAIDTPAWAGAPQEARDAAASLIPMGRFGEENEIATAALFLASQDSS
jgi:NAD(P)-dependent dehydrogenase (short-subunit alcohol dehydrogenase family)